MAAKSERLTTMLTIVGAVAVVALILIIVAVQGGSSSHHTARSTQGSSANQRPSGADRTTSANPSTAVNQSGDSVPSKAPNHQDVDDNLLTALQTVTEAYYRYLPGETPLERVNNLPSFVPASVRQQIVFYELPKSGDAIRVSKQLTIRGTLLNSTVEGYEVPGHPTQISVQASALTDFVNPDGTIYSVGGQQAESEAPFASVWQRGSNDSWTLLRFVDGGDTGTGQ